MSRFEHRQEHDELRATVRRFLQRRCDESAVRQQLGTPTGYDPATWQVLSEQLGVAGLSVPEEFGGLGLGQTELRIVMEEAGRSLLCAPLLSTVVLGLDVLVGSSDTEVAPELIGAVVAGRRTLALALSGPAAPWVSQPAPTAEGRGRVRPVTGRVPFVVDGASADRVLVVADAVEGPTLLLLDEAAQVTRTPMDILDLTRRQAWLDLDRAPARVLGDAGEALGVLAGTLARARTALAAESVGVCRQLLAMAVDYAKLRHQFDRPIGSFQAVKHMCSEMLIATELADSAVQAAAGALDAGPDGPDDAVLLSHVAASAAADACDLVAAEAIEVHGGIGFTWEHPAHLYYKRAVSSARLWGTASWHRGRLLARLRDHRQDAPELLEAERAVAR